MKYLIVSADDFGLTNTINEGIVKACKKGIVTCVNLMPSGNAFENALKLSKEIGLTEAGAHLSLTQTRPLTEPRKISTLVTPDGNFYNGRNAFFLRFISSSIDLDQAYLELKRQMDVLDMAGFRITNLSSHEHIHIVPAILDIFVKLAKEFNVPAIRFPHEDKSFSYGINMIYKNLILSFFEKRMRKILNASDVVYPEHFRGFFDSGKMQEEVVLKILGSLEEGTTELVCHPGIPGQEVLDRYSFHKNCEAELHALTSQSVRKLIKDKGIELLSYGNFLLKHRE